MRVRLTRYAALATALMAAFLALCGSGCGGPSEDEAQETAEEFVAALSEGDLLALCELWTQEARVDFFSLFGAIDRVEDGCPADEREFAAPSSVNDALGKDISKDTDVTLFRRGDSPVFEVEGFVGGLVLVERDGQWAVDSVCVGGECQRPTTREAPIGD